MADDVVKVDSPLTEFGTCDEAGCGSVAAVEVRKLGSALLLVLCAHHYAEREAPMFVAGFVLNRDARHLLKVRP